MRSLLVMGNPYRHAPLVSIVTLARIIGWHVKGSGHETVMFSQAAVRFLVGQPWRNKHGKASPLAWFALRGARVKPESGPSCQQPLTSKLRFDGGR